MEQIVIPRGCIIVTGQTKAGKSAMAKAYAEKYPESTFVIDDDAIMAWTPGIRRRMFEENKGKKIVLITEDPSRYTTEEPSEELVETECPCCYAEFSFGGKAVDLHHCCDPEVIEIKECYAEIIDHLNDARDSQTNYDKKRLYSIAITEAETACMWAVKALTHND